VPTFASDTSSWPRIDVGVTSGDPRTRADCARWHSRTELRLLAHEIREGVVGWALDDASHPYHLGGSLSCADILAVLYNDVMHHAADCDDPSDRDRFVLSKGHAALALYPALRQVGLVTNADFEKGLFGPDAVLFKEPRRDMARGIEMTSGSLGMGACPTRAESPWAKVSRRTGPDAFSVSHGGRGVCNEGSVWEAGGPLPATNRLTKPRFAIIEPERSCRLDAPTSEVA